MFFFIFQLLLFIFIDKAAAISFKDIVAEKFGYIKYAGYKGHSDWARSARYMPNLDCILTCSTTDQNSLVIGWLEKFRQPKQIRTAKCSVEQGFLHFDFNTRLSLIATAGCNHHICFWNPYVVSKPNGILHGHMAPVVQVIFVDSRSQLISFSKDKVLRLWDIALQTCLQRIAGIFPKIPERNFVCLNFQILITYIILQPMCISIITKKSNVYF